MRSRFWLEVASASVGVILFVVTLISREWIELISGVDADHGSGALELAIVFGILAISVGSALSAVREWRRPSTA